jgi:ankyrin repeat protein
LVNLFVEHGADVNFCKPDKGRTPLHVAAMNGNVPLAEYLIQRGAKVDAKDAAGKMPVDYAREYKEEATVQFLVAQTPSNNVAAEVAFDGSLSSSIITEELILNAKCKRCSKAATKQTLTLYAGNDFYVCPECGVLFCDQCILTLPLTGLPGYAKCPTCDVQLKRPVPGAFA